ncbi:MAG: hypothetical protein WBE82_06360, partial [Xanthobacteraceae bacterium]
LANADLLVDARPVLGGGLRQLHWAANGYCLLCDCDDGASLYDAHYKSASHDTMDTYRQCRTVTARIERFLL